MIGAFLMAAIAVLPADRLAMADRLLNAGNFEDAVKEYRALVGEKGIAPDELIFRIAECDRAVGRTAAALKGYEEVYGKYPDSRHAARARFMRAMGAEGDVRRRLLAELDSDRVDPEIRTAALYHLGSENSDTEALTRCVKLDPKGKYAPYANLKYGMLLNASADPVQRRKGVEVLLGLAFGSGPLADEALYLAAIQSYREKRYSEAGSLFRRYRRNHPKGEHLDEARSMSAWCDFLEGRYADAAAACGDGDTDDLAYIRAACAYSIGDNVKALELFGKYLEDYPSGRYVADAKLPIARIEFDEAQKSNNVAKAIESAKRGVGLSRLASDHLRLAWAYEKASKDDAALEEYVLVAKEYPGSTEATAAMYLKAMIEARRENWQAVELSLAEALSTGKIGKRKAEALYWRGIAAMRIGHSVEGADFLSQAIDAGLGLDEAREAKLMIADLDFREGRIEKAKAAYVVLVREGACERMSASRMLSVGKLLEGAEAETCAKALVKSEAPEWRQAGWALLGGCQERSSAFSSAIDSYRKCLAEPVTTEDGAAASLALGKLEYRAGELQAAETTLKKSIALNADNARARAEAYLTLAKVAGARDDWKSACAYATVVTSLFDDEDVIAEAKRILAAHPEARK